MNNEDISKVVRITYERAGKQVAHPTYPQHEDLAQNCLTNWVARDYKNPSTTTKYTLLSDYNRKTKPEFNKSYSEVEITDLVSDESQSKDIISQIDLKDFFDWLPSGRASDMFYRNCIRGEELSEIARDYNVSRQALHVSKTKFIQRYKEEKGISCYK